jgi:hypothetical protein
VPSELYHTSWLGSSFPAGLVALGRREHKILRLLPKDPDAPIEVNAILDSNSRHHHGAGSSPILWIAVLSIAATIPPTKP